MEEERQMPDEEKKKDALYWTFEEQVKREPHKRKYLTAIGVIGGLDEGLSKYFRRRCRTAVIFANQSLNWTEFIICDPSDLLSSHHVAIENFFEEPNSVKKTVEEILFGKPRMGPEIPGFFSYVIQDTETIFQLWFVELPPNAYSIEPLEGWLLRTSSFMNFEPSSIDQTVNYGVAGAILVSNLAKDAIATGLALKFESENHKDYKRFNNIVSIISTVSQTVEEGSLPLGNILFCEVDDALQTQIPFEPRAPLNLHKHIVKLLAAVAGNQDHCLLANLSEVIALATFKQLPKGSLLAKFKIGEDELIAADGSKICGFYNGEFYGAEPPSISDVLERYDDFRQLNPELRSLVKKQLQDIVTHAQQNHHGCSIVLDFDECPSRLIAGHLLTESFELSSDSNDDDRQLFLNSSAIDGALYLQITKTTLRVRGFGCILAGDATNTEDRSKGSRHNSAIRFTRSYEKCVVIVVSEDGPASVFASGTPLQILRAKNEKMEKEATRQKVYFVADWMAQINLTS
ncbi:DNA integrity scanning protein DisA nucleotide-binding domain protein [bacterium]|nr:DNA integrity scanning protein DisA nucleotide-binding domain protein [bacterium]